MNYAIRISRSYHDISGSIVKMAELSEKALWYEHKADKDISRTHVHGLLLLSAIKTDTAKNWIKKELGVTEFDKADWSWPISYKCKKTKQKINITNENYNRFICYMTKGVLDPVYNKGIDTSVIEVAKSEWVVPTPFEPRESSKIAYKIIQPETPKEKKLREWELLQLLSKACKEQCPESFDRDKCIEVVVTELKKLKHCLSKFKIKEWVEKVEMHEYTKSFIDSVREFMRPRY